MARSWPLLVLSLVLATAAQAELQVHLEFEGDLSDSAGGDNNGILVDGDLGSHEYGPGAKGRGLILQNPNSSIGGDYVSIPYTMPEAGTIALWYKPTSTYANNTIFDNSAPNTSTPSKDSWKMAMYTYSMMQFSIAYNSSVDVDLSTLTQGDPRNRWWHIAVTWQKMDTIVAVKLYINGKLIREDNNGPWVASGPSLFLCGGNPGNRCGTGVYDDVRIYNQVLNGYEIVGLLKYPGEGTVEDPYRIGSVADWQMLILQSEDWDKSFVLTADIDFGGSKIIPVALGSTHGPDGFHGIVFSGIMAGDDHSLSNFVIEQGGDLCIGLFSCLDRGQIRNLGAVNFDIAGYVYVGGLVGFNGGTITSCFATGIVKGEMAFIGGITGDSTGTITSCNFNGSVGGHSIVVGGIAGCNNRGFITSCYAKGTVTGGERAGGLVGHNYWGTITSCYSNGNVGPGWDAGGLVGYNEGTITACYATGTVNGSEYTGSLVGSNEEGTVTACFWETNRIAQQGSSGGKGLTTEQMKTLSIFQNAGWADMGWIIQDGADYPRLSWENTEGTPIPPAEAVPLSGNGTAEDPYVITTAEEFAALSWYSGVLDKFILLNNDLDLSGVLIYPIGDLGLFSGVFDGQGRILSNFGIQQSGSEFVGLFAIVGPGGQIRNLGLEQVTIDGRYHVGGLVGLNQGTLTGCHSFGTVNGSKFYIGGLVGGNSGTITTCYATGTVGGVADVGGLVGENWRGTLIACDAIVSVDGEAHVGGLVGGNSGTITSCFANGIANSNGYEVGGLVGSNTEGTLTACYATGMVNGSQNLIGGLCGENFGGTFNNCFWDIQTSGRTDGVGNIDPDPAGMKGKTTAEMKTLSTFTDAGWDFVGESANGTVDSWRMCTDGVDYPRLSWEFAQVGDFDCPNGVAIEDLLYLASRWLATNPETIGAAAANSDGKVDLSDLAILAAHWLK
jgi:hypothetical protein